MAAPAIRPGRRSRHKGPQSDAHANRRPSRKRTGRGKAEHGLKRSKKPLGHELALQVSQELVKLRPLLKDIGTALLDRLDGELAGLSSALAGEGLSGEPANLPPASILSGMLTDIQAIKVKPKKGRLKDLGRIEILLEYLSGRMPPDA